MTRVRVWPTSLVPRSEHIILGGTKQDKARALFCMLLPDDGSCYTAAEVVKRALPLAEQLEAYRLHAKALYDLAHDKGITGKREGDPGPDNIDAQGRLLPGKRGHTQRPRWHARSWQAIISDEIWAWLLGFNDDLISRTLSYHSLGYEVVLWCDLENLSIVEEWGPPLSSDWGCWTDPESGSGLVLEREPMTMDAYRQALIEQRALRVGSCQDNHESPLPALFPSPSQRPLKRSTSWRFLAGVACALLGLIQGPESRPDRHAPPLQAVIEAQFVAKEVDDYLLSEEEPQAFTFSVPASPSKLAANWKANTNEHEERLANTPMFVASFPRLHMRLDGSTPDRGL